MHYLKIIQKLKRNYTTNKIQKIIEKRPKKAFLMLKKLSKRGLKNAY